LHNFSWCYVFHLSILTNCGHGNGKIFTCGAPQKEKERKRKENLVLRAFISPPANTWDTLEKRWDTLARMLAPALYISIDLYIQLFPGNWFKIYGLHNIFAFVLLF
jgi:hypothetical protein